jgi:tRNA (guanosine-2'-O-)-methyltransferase
MSKITDTLRPLLTPARLARIEEVLSHRTRNLVLLFEQVWNPHNVSACMRSAEALGLQEIHVIEKDMPFAPKKDVVQGSAKWLDVYRYPDVSAGLSALKSRGFTIAAGALTEDAVPLEQLDFKQKFALSFGNEHEGLTTEFLEQCDVVFKVPMLGFTQSFNISVSAALCIYHAVSQRLRDLGRNGDLTEEEKEALREAWMINTVPMAREILERAGLGAPDLEGEEDA